MKLLKIEVVNFTKSGRLLIHQSWCSNINYKVMENKLRQFIKLFSDKKPKLDEIISSGIDAETANELLNVYELNLKFDHIVQKENLLETFFYNIFTKGFSIFNFTFYESLKYNESYITFGHVDTYSLVQIRKTNEIAIYSDYTEYIEYISNSFETFLDLLIILVEYEATEYQEVISIKKNNNIFIERIIDLLNEEKYYTYFIDILK